MNKKWLLLSLILIAILAISTACNGGHTHSFSNDWSKDATYHWHECEGCDEVEDKAEHNYGDDNKCDDCGYEKLSEGLRYEYDEETDSYIVIGIGDCTDTHIVIPETYNDKPVVGMQNYAFYDCNSLTRIDIPNSITNIGDNALSGCTNLTRITIGNYISSIGIGAFYGCSSLTSIDIPNSITSIGDYAFSGCNSLNYNTNKNVDYLGNKDNQYLVLVKEKDKSITEFNIEHNTKIIMNSAFNDCSSLTSIKIPNSVTSIGNETFYGCSSLTSIEIPNSVTSIGNEAFSYCTSVESIKVAEDNKKYYSQDNCLIERETQTLILGCKNSKIPSVVTSIGDRAFEGCSSLKSLTIPNSVTSIGSNAFNGCSIEEAIMPTLAISSIPKGRLKKVVITDGKSIGDKAFNGCSRLENIEIPNSLTNIGKNAFNGCDNLKEVYYHGSAKEWYEITIGENNNDLISATLYFYSDNDPKLSGDYNAEYEYYHYNDQGEIVVW